MDKNAVDEIKDFPDPFKNDNEIKALYNPFENEDNKEDEDDEMDLDDEIPETTVKEMVDKCMDPNYQMIPIRYRIHRNSLSMSLKKNVDSFIENCVLNPDSEVLFENDSSRLDSKLILRIPDYTQEMLYVANAVFVGDIRLDLEVSLMGLRSFSGLSHPVSIIRWDSFISGVQLYEKVPTRYMGIEFSSTYIDRITYEESAKSISERREIINNSLTRIEKLWHEFNVSI